MVRENIYHKISQPHMVTDVKAIKPVLVGVKIDIDSFNAHKSLFDSLVSEQRRKKAKQFRKLNDTIRSLFGDVLVRYCIISTCKIRNDDIYFTFSKYGKPVCTHLNNIDFSISHSGDWVFVGVSNHAIGIDIEHIRPTDLKISNRFFTVSETQQILQQKNVECKNEMLYRIWVLKEAYLKAIGKGLYCSLKSFAIAIKDNSYIELELQDNMLPKYFLREYEFDPSKYKIGCCCAQNHFPEKIQTIEISEVLKRIINQH